MKSVSDIFAELGIRLAYFGEDALSRTVIERAVEQNEWFTEASIRYAVDAIRCDMLDKQRIEEWLTHYPTKCGGKRVAIIMAGNIPLVGFFDLMCVIASGNIPCVKPSSKDWVLEEFIESQLMEIEPALRIERYDASQQYNAVIATGGDSANLHFRTAFASIPSLLRGSRHSVSVLMGDENEEQLASLAEDIFTYCGLGCRNVSMLFVPRGYKVNIKPRRELVSQPYINNYKQCRALLSMSHRAFDDLGIAVVVRGEAEFPRYLSQINIVEYDRIDEVRGWLERNDERIQCVTSCTHLTNRCVKLGMAQHPSLFDYADERDTMHFLSNL